TRLLDTRHASNDDEVKRVLALPAPDLPAPRPDTDPIDWAQESCRIVQQPGFYPDSPAIGDDYTRRFLPVAESQLRLAGERLGRLLNAVLDPAGRK
ncbi:S1/P1 nuclease, partial [Nocardia gipuzkoensis]